MLLLSPNQKLWFAINTYWEKKKISLTKQSETGNINHIQGQVTCSVVNQHKIDSLFFVTVMVWCFLSFFCFLHFCLSCFLMREMQSSVGSILEDLEEGKACDQTLLYEKLLKWNPSNKETKIPNQPKTDYHFLKYYGKNKKQNPKQGSCWCWWLKVGLLW